MKAFIWFAFALLSVASTGLAALTVKASDWLLGAVASAQGGEALGNAVKQPLPEALEPWISPVWLAAPREVLLKALRWRSDSCPRPMASWHGSRRWYGPVGRWARLYCWRWRSGCTGSRAPATGNGEDSRSVRERAVRAAAAVPRARTHRASRGVHRGVMATFSTPSRWWANRS